MARRAVVGELGESMYFRVPVRSLVGSRFLSTFFLSVAALAIAIAVAFSLGIAAARYKSKTLSQVIEFVVFFTASTPRIVLALVALADRRADFRGEHRNCVGRRILACRDRPRRPFDLDLSCTVS